MPRSSSHSPMGRSCELGRAESAEPGPRISRKNTIRPRRAEEAADTDRGQGRPWTLAEPCGRSEDDHDFGTDGRGEGPLPNARGSAAATTAGRSTSMDE